MRTLYECYKNPSIYKRRAWSGCEALCKDYNGFELTVNSYNCQMFTARFNFFDNDTGELKTMKITKSYTRII